MKQTRIDHKQNKRVPCLRLCVSMRKAVGWVEFHETHHFIRFMVDLARLEPPNGLKRVLLLAVLTLISLAGLGEQAMAVDRPIERSLATRSPAVGKHGMAATSQPLATQAAIDILKAGGNAVDAAIAANAVLGVTEPMSCGPGGDLFAIVWDAETKKLYGLNASGRSPHGLSLEEFHSRKLHYIPLRGPLCISVPGCVDGWAELHRRFGKLPLAKILA